MPYLFTIDGTLVKLPLPAGTTGTASSVTTDRWVAGNYLTVNMYSPAVWKVQ